MEDSKKIFGHEVKHINCPYCNRDVSVVYAQVFESRRLIEVFELQKRLIKKMIDKETLYLRDTNGKTENIRVLMWDPLRDMYVDMSSPNGELAFKNEWIVYIIRGEGIKDHLEFIDIYGNRNS